MRKKFLSAYVYGAIALATAGMVVSCSDYDDDIDNLQEQIDGLNASTTKLEAELTAAKTALESQMEQMKSSYETKIAEAVVALQSADETMQSSLTERIVALETELAAKEASLKTQIEACNTALAQLEASVSGKASKEELDALTANVAIINSTLTGNYELLAEQLNKLSSETGVSISNILERLATMQSNSDEAFKAVDAQMAEVLKQVAAAKAEAANYADTQIKAEEAARITAQENLQAQIDALVAWQNEINGKNLDERLQGVEGGIQALGVWKEEANAKIDGIVTDIAELRTKIAANELGIAELKQSLTIVNEAINSLQGQVSILAVLVEKSINSLVFVPSKYLYGFGVIDVMSFTGCETFNKKTTSSTLSVEGDYEYVKPTTQLLSTWTPTAHARYHLNPTTADVTKYDFSFNDVETKNQFTRANDYKSIGASAGEVAVTNGVLDVEVKIAYPQNLNDAVTYYREINLTDGSQVTTPVYAWVSTLALQATKKEADKVSDDVSVAAGTITSDYALVVPSYYGNLIIANKEGRPAHEGLNNRSNHLRTSAKETIHDDLYTFEVAYNKELDLAKKIETHYGMSTSADGPKVGDVAFTDDEFAASGLKYQYSLVSYKMAEGSNKDQASVAQVDANTGVTKPESEDAKYIGETYVVRVLLLDGNGKVLSCGYVKVLITDQGADNAQAQSAITLDCRKGNKSSVQLPTIVEQFKAIYNSTLVVSDFINSKYVLDPTPYKETGVNAEAYGKGCFSIDEESGELVLSFDESEAKSIYYPEDVVDPTKEVKVYARFIHQENGYSDLWVEYTINPVNYAKGTFTKADKIARYWYAENSGDQGYAEIHANVATEGAPTFDFNILNTFVGAKAHITGNLEDLKAFKDDPNADFYIAETNNGRIVNGTSGLQYELLVNDACDTLFACKVGEDRANAQAVVTLKAVYNEYDGIASFMKEPYAMDILNYASHKQLGKDETFTVYMIMKQNRNCYNVELTDNTFNVRFLRPINTQTNESLRVTMDGEDGGGYWFAQDLVSFYDWRDYAFEQNPGFYDFYGVTTSSIQPSFVDATTGKILRATTDINGNPSDLLEEVAPNLNLTWDASASDAAHTKIHGKIAYVNNGATVNGDFHISVPITITYKWGRIYTRAELTISRTIANIRPLN